MITPEDYKAIAEAAYSVDPLKRNPPYAENTTISAGPGKSDFLVIDVENDPVTGFQALTAVPIVGGVPDYSQIVVSFAGTNPDDRADMMADAKTLAGGDIGPGTQAAEALAYARKIRDEQSKKHPGAAFSTAGHSLGAFLALLIACEFGWAGTTFNGPDPWNVLSSQAKEWLRRQHEAGRHPLANYVNERDLIGNSMGNGTGSAVYVKGLGGTSLFDHHDLATGFRFGSDGAVTGAGVEGRSDWDIANNILNEIAPGLGIQFAPVVAGMLTALRNPVIGGTAGNLASAVMVLVNTEAALGLAASFGTLAVSLAQIKVVNGDLTSRLQGGLDIAKSAVSWMPFITESDIEYCIDANNLRVPQLIDERAVAEVDRLVDDHIHKAGALSAGITQTVLNTAAQDLQWATSLGR